MQRLRLRFGRGEEVKFISHLDIMRFWERAFRRAEILLAYSQGFTPHPRISLAAPLPIGVTSEFELMDVWLNRWMPPKSLLMKLKKQLPPGFDVFEAWEVGLHVPSLQSSIAFAEYRVDLKTERGEKEIQDSLDSLLQTKQLPWHHSRGDKVHFYDLRELIDSLWLISYHDSFCVLGMRLRCDPSGSGRPEQVVGALSLCDYPESIHRTRLTLRQ
jgi:radical SAM-linked protein